MVQVRDASSSSYLRAEAKRHSSEKQLQTRYFFSSLQKYTIDVKTLDRYQLGNKDLINGVSGNFADSSKKNIST